MDFQDAINALLPRQVNTDVVMVHLHTIKFYRIQFMHFSRMECSLLLMKQYCNGFIVDLLPKYFASQLTIKYSSEANDHPLVKNISTIIAWKALSERMH